MSRAVTFEGSIVVNGFPRNSPFSFDVQDDRIILKSGKEVFLIVEKEPLPQTQEAPPQGTYTGYEALSVPPQPSLQAVEEKPRKERAPNFKPDPTDTIFLPPDFKKEYTKARQKWFETLGTAHGRTVGWWLNSSMVKNLEGSASSMLKFFVEEGAVKLLPSSETVPSNQRANGRVSPPTEQAQAQRQPGDLPSWVSPPPEQTQAQGQQASAGNAWNPPVNSGSLPPGGSRFLG
jgi:hypothetical protein